MNRSQKKSISVRQNKKRAKLLSACLAGGEKRGWLVIALSSNVSSSEQQAAPTPAGIYNALRAHICHKYRKLYLWRKNCHVEKFWEILRNLEKFMRFHVEKN